MAGNEIDIGIAGNSKKFRDATDDVEKALEEVSDTLDDLVDDTKKGGRDSERAVDELADSFDDVRKAAKEAGDAGDRAGKDIDDGMDRAKKGTDDFKQEANSTAKEAAASFDGSAESIGDAFQEIAANAFEGFGPAGAVAGLAAAAGIGLAVAGFEDIKEANEASQEAAAEWASKYIESGDLVISKAQQVAEVTAIAADPERYNEAKKNAEDWGVSVGTAMQAMAGNETAIEASQEALDKITEANINAATGAETYGDSYYQAAGRVQEATNKTAKAQESLDKITGSMEAGRQAALDTSDALYGIIDDAEGASIQVDELGNKLVTLKGNDDPIFIDADTKQASLAIDKFHGEVDDIPKTKAVVVKGTVDLDKSAIANYRPSIRVTTSFFDRHGKRVL